jgi:Tfp pilus assembly PilM family ATPase
MNPPEIFIEIGQSSLKALRENDGVELPLERQPDGRLTESCKEKTIASLKIFLQAKNWQSRTRAVCAIGARGVSLRKLSLPASAKEEFHKRLLLQIESEFPLPPDELAWGWRQLGEAKPSNGTMAKSELLVAAVKKEIVADYQEILVACGTSPVFTLAALARNNICPQPQQACAMLDIGSSQSELTAFEKNVPTVSRILFWGGENVSDAADAKLDALAQTIKSSLTATKLFISGNKISEDFTSRLSKSLGNGWQCERLEVAVGEGHSAAISGLKKFADQDPTLVIRVKQTSGTTNLTAPDLKKWATRAILLFAILMLLPYAEALLLKPHLAKKVSAFKADAARLAVIDRELDFLQYLKQSQPPYLDALFVFSKSAPQGTKFDALSMDSHGVVSLRGSFRDGQQVADFRGKLIASGFFANVTVEEQTPSPDRQKVNVRMTAQEKSATQLQSLAIGPTADEIEKAKNKPAAQPGMMPPGLSAMPPMAVPTPGRVQK